MSINFNLDKWAILLSVTCLSFCSGCQRRSVKANVEKELNPHVIFFESNMELHEGALTTLTLGTNGFRNIDFGKVESVKGVFSGDQLNKGDSVFVNVVLEPELEIQEMFAFLNLIHREFEALGVAGTIYAYPQ